ncbi:MAG: peptidoglycan-binding domain-containing protein [Paracoccaceae bacterium]
MPTRYTVKKGDCISSIGESFGFFPDTLWELPENAELREKRENAYVLMPGEDQVFVPDLRPKDISCATGKRHRFRRKGVPERLRLRLLDDQGEPRAQLPYSLTIDGDEQRDKTDEDGLLLAWIPPRALSGELVLDPDGDAPVTHNIKLGHLTPIDDPKGVAARLMNLGYALKDAQGKEDAGAAIGAFQADEGLPVTNEIDEATRARLLERHKS